MSCRRSTVYPQPADIRRVLLLTKPVSSGCCRLPSFLSNPSMCAIVQLEFELTNKAWRCYVHKTCEQPPELWCRFLYLLSHSIYVQLINLLLRFELPKPNFQLAHYIKLGSYTCNQIRVAYGLNIF
jgi:hypothetical protein